MAVTFVPPGKLHIYELEAGGSATVHKVVPFSMNPPLYVHDFAVTANWCALQGSCLLHGCSCFMCRTCCILPMRLKKF